MNVYHAELCYLSCLSVTRMLKTVPKKYGFKDAGENLSRFDVKEATVFKGVAALFPYL